MRDRETEAPARLSEGGSHRSGEGPAELRALELFAQALQAATPRPDEAFKGELRAMLLEEARLQQAAAAPRILPRVRTLAAATAERWRYSTRMAAASLAAALTFSSGGAMAVAAERALPSDPLYGVKLALDDARAAVRLDAAAKGQVYLGNAEERIGDAELAALHGDQSGAARALRESADDAREGARQLIRAYEERGDADLVATLDAFAETQSQRVRVLAERLDGDARAAARSSLVVLERIEERLVVIGGACGDCPAEGPSSGAAFDFSEIPPADEPFQPCPCDEDTDDTTSRPDDAGDEPDRPRPTASPTPPDDDDGDDDDGDGGDDPIEGLPDEVDPVTDVVNDILKPFGTSKSAEKGLGGIAPSPSPSKGAPSAGATPSVAPTAVPSGGLGLPIALPDLSAPGL